MCFVTSIDSIHEPEFYNDAIKDERWIEAMDSEIRALKDNKTWTLVPLPKGKRAIGCKWVYKVKYDSNGKVDKFKARLVAKGYSQKEGIDYHETFSPVVKMLTVRLVLKLAAMHNWDLHQMDVCNAFLQGDLDEEVYMEIPQGFAIKGENLVCRLNKSLYGLKQASRQWNSKLCEALSLAGFKQSEYDHSLFIQNRVDGDVLILVYVDDLLITGSSKSGIHEVKTFLHSTFKIKDLGFMKYFLGIELARSNDGIILCQRKYVLDILAETGMSGCRPLKVPLAQNQKLVAFEEGRNKKDELLRDPERYRKLVGKLIYLTMTRPDISFCVQTLSQFMQMPTKEHMAAALNVVRYLKGSPGVGVLLSSRGSLELECFCDADWGSCRTTRRSVTGYLLKFGGSLVMWKTKKQATVSKSSAEAEYRALSMAVSEIVWTVGMIKDLKISCSIPVKVFCDNQAAIHIANNPVFHERTKHIEVDCHFVREKLKKKIITLQHVRSEDQQADLLTKAVGMDVQRKLLGKLEVVDMFQPPI